MIPTEDEPVFENPLDEVLARWCADVILDRVAREQEDGQCSEAA